MNDSQNNSASTNESNHLIYPWHSKSWNNFINARKQNHLPHAILLSGEQGIGKLSLAKRMAKSLLCMNTVSESSDACNQCQSCKTYESGANPDHIQIGLLEDKKQIGVDQIRALSEFLNYSRSYNTYRVVIINPVERMNINAANSLLKSLEEPTDNTVIILVTSKVSDLLATIRSRCQLVNVSSPNKDESIAWLTHNSNNNDSIDAELLFEMVGSSPLNAKNISQEDVDNKQQFFKDLLAVVKLQASLTEMAKKWEKSNFELLINWQLVYLQKNIKTTLKAVPSDENNSVQNTQLTQHLNSEEQWQLYQTLIKQKQYIHTSVNPQMFMENMIMLWTKAG